MDQLELIASNDIGLLGARRPRLQEAASGTICNCGPQTPGWSLVGVGNEAGVPSVGGRGGRGERTGSHAARKSRAVMTRRHLRWSRLIAQTPPLIALTLSHHFTVVLYKES
ncbi:hypothetical protein JYU34_018449 [Plutella xylostella]|uniref:Uncharacterized protein n=1 Tax=Plutella xylostella TaxID=51655 RepID=A0ABQ7PXM0_PLUXY|nr:hypothetical protein JYU34_018449 [Plutella xylostella]